jgi:hypothetical protein
MILKVSVHIYNALTDLSNKAANIARQVTNK